MIVERICPETLTKKDIQAAFSTQPGKGFNPYKKKASLKVENEGFYLRFSHTNLPAQFVEGFKSLQSAKLIEQGRTKIGLTCTYQGSDVQSKPFTLMAEEPIAVKEAMAYLGLQPTTSLYEMREQNEENLEYYQERERSYGLEHEKDKRSMEFDDYDHKYESYDSKAVEKMRLAIAIMRTYVGIRY